MLNATKRFPHQVRTLQNQREEEGKVHQLGLKVGQRKKLNDDIAASMKNKQG